MTHDAHDMIGTVLCHVMSVALAIVNDAPCPQGYGLPSNSIIVASVHIQHQATAGIHDRLKAGS